MYARTLRYNVQPYSTRDIEKEPGGGKPRHEGSSQGGQREAKPAGKPVQFLKPVQSVSYAKSITLRHLYAGIPPRPRDPTIFKSDRSHAVIQVPGRNFSPIRDRLDAETSWSFHFFLSRFPVVLRGSCPSRVYCTQSRIRQVRIKVRNDSQLLLRDSILKNVCRNWLQLLHP